MEELSYLPFLKFYYIIYHKVSFIVANRLPKAAIEVFSKVAFQKISGKFSRRLPRRNSGMDLLLGIFTWLTDESSAKRIFTLTASCYVILSLYNNHNVVTMTLRTIKIRNS